MPDNIETKVALLAQDVEYIKSEVDKISAKLDTSFVTKQEFQPVKQITFGMISIVVVSVFGAIVSYFVNVNGGP